MASTCTSRAEQLKWTQQYPYPSHVNAASFLSIKLSGKANYYLWRQQMMFLVESHDMLGFLDGTFKNPRYPNGDSKMKADKTRMEAKHREWKRSDTLVKWWIFGSLTEDMMYAVMGLDKAKDMWEKLKATCIAPPAPINQEIDTDELLSSIVEVDADEHKANDDRELAKDLYDDIVSGEWDRAFQFTENHRDMGTSGTDILDALNVIADSQEAYFSGTQYNFYQKLIYSHVPTKTKNHSMGKFVSKHWKVEIRLVPHIKHLQENKVKHNKALSILRFICKQVASPEAYEEVKEAISRALELDSPEPIQEIYATYPDARYIQHNGYNVTQLAIINRHEKIYNYLMTNNHAVVSIDKDGNSLLHLAGLLAPTEKLNLVSGAATVVSCQHLSLF